MPDKKCAGLFSGGNNCAEPVCIHTSKVSEHLCRNIVKARLPAGFPHVRTNSSEALEPSNYPDS